MIDIRRNTLRYCALRGLFLLSSDKAFLRRVQSEIARYLERLRLHYNPTKVELRRTTERVDVLGYVVSRQRRWLRNDNGYRARQRLNRIAEAFARGELDWDDVNQRLKSWIGHARHGETLGLRRTMFSAVSFSREQTECRAPRAAGRLVEQQPEEVAFCQP